MIDVTHCGNCPVFELDRCKRLNMTMYENDPPCDWATLGERPEDFAFTIEDTAELQEWTRKHQPELADRLL